MSSALSTRVSQALSPLFGRDPFSSFQREMDELLSKFQSDWNGNGNGLLAANLPSLDLSETDDALQVRMDVPGMKADEINIEVSGNTLRVSGEHKEEKEEKGKTFHRLERRSGSFNRTVALPVAVKEGQVTAETADGVLTIKLPKVEAAKTQKVAVKPAAK